MAERKVPRKRKVRAAFRWLELTLLVLIAAVLTALMFPIYAGDPPNPRTACLSNIKQLALSQLMYMADHDNRLPHRAWRTASFEYRKTEDLRCPRVVEEHPDGYGYALNSGLENLDTTQVKRPEDVIIIFESADLALNASDPCLTMPNPGRHEGKNTIAFLDGHAKAMTMDEWKSKRVAP